MTNLCDQKVVLSYVATILHYKYCRSRTVTRSVNKGVKGDLPSAMEKQVTRCDEPVEPLLKLFFKNEHLDISWLYFELIV